MNICGCVEERNTNQYPDLTPKIDTLVSSFALPEAAASWLISMYILAVCNHQQRNTRPATCWVVSSAQQTVDEGEPPILLAQFKAIKKMCCNL